MVRIYVDEYYGFSKKDKEIAQAGLNRLEEALNDREFGDMILKASYTWTNHRTPVQIYERLMSGADDMDERADGIINLRFSMYSKWFSKVIGWVTPGTRMIHINRKYFGRVNDFSSNVLHEYSHMIGLTERSASDWGCVPYMLNKLFAIWCDRRGY